MGNVHSGYRVRPAVLAPKRPPRRHDPIRVINGLTHTKGPFGGTSFKLRGWQKRILRQLFTRRPDGLRQYRTCLLMLPRKQGKTELCAALAIYFLLYDGEIGAEIYTCAADRTQASHMFEVAAQMIRNSRALAAQCEINETQKRIMHRASGSVYRAISAEAYSKYGFNASVVLYDELHAAPTRELWDVMATSQSARAQPLMMAITTAGYDRSSILYELYSHAKKVQADPALDPTFLPIIYEAPEEADWTDERVWHACNPALGDFRSLEEMRVACQRAQQIPAQENVFRRMYLNQWTEQAERWMPMASWHACRQAIDWPAYAGRPCYVGIDLSSTTDLTALVAVFPEDDEDFSVLPCCFLPTESVKVRSTRDRRDYAELARRGYLTLTPGPVVDYEAVRAQLQVWDARYDVQMLGYDPWNATDLVTRLEAQDGFQCVPIRQGFASLSAPTKALTAAILSKRLRHDGHPVLTDHIGNAAVSQDAAGNLKLDKAASSGKIDALAALVCAVDLLTRQRHRPAPSYSCFVLSEGH